MQQTELTAQLRAVVNSLELILERLENPSKGPTSDAQLITEVLSAPTLRPDTRALITGIEAFLTERGYLSDKQRDTVRAMHTQHVRN